MTEFLKVMRKIIGKKNVSSIVNVTSSLSETPLKTLVNI